MKLAYVCGDMQDGTRTNKIQRHNRNVFTLYVQMGPPNELG